MYDSDVRDVDYEVDIYLPNSQSSYDNRYSIIRDSYSI